MHFIQFSNLRAIEYPDARTFEQRAGRWLEIREGENSYLLGKLPTLVARARQIPPITGGERMFTVEEGDHIRAAGVLFGAGCLCLSWATDDVAETLARHMATARCQINSIYAPEHTSLHFARQWSALTQQPFEADRSERVYQLARCTYQPPAAGRLAMATEQDEELLLPWITQVIAETELELEQSPKELLTACVANRALYLWKQPEPVSMASWISPTPHGGSINLVYTPPEHRGKGHAKAVVAALGMHMLANGRKFCFIMTDPENSHTNRLYQSIGARTICELVRCRFQPPVSETRDSSSQSRATGRPEMVVQPGSKSTARFQTTVGP